jgi:hypothetical protein
MTYLDGSLGGGVRVMTCPEDGRGWASLPRSFVAVGLRDNPNGTRDGWARYNVSRPLAAFTRPTDTILVYEYWEGNLPTDAYASGRQPRASWSIVDGWQTASIQPWTRGGRSPWYHGAHIDVLCADGHCAASAPGALYRSGTDSDWRVDW